MTRKKKGGEPEVDVRGQMSVTLAGADYMLRPDYEAIEAIEIELGRSIMELSRLALLGQLAIADQAVIIAELMKGHGRQAPDAGASYKAPDPKKIGRMIFESAAMRVRAIIAIILTAATIGGYTVTGEPKPVT